MNVEFWEALPAIVDTKIDRRDHALLVKPSGTGMRNLMARPMAIEAASGASFAPCVIHANQSELCFLAHSF